MGIKTSVDDPFYHILSQGASRLGAIDVLSLTDRRGDIIALVNGPQGTASLSPDDLGYIQVYGQLALQHAPHPLLQMSARRGHRRWMSRSIEVNGDRYDLWLSWSTLYEDRLTCVDVELALKHLAQSLLPLLRD